jgi:hypothetical protein
MEYLHILNESVYINASCVVSFCKINFNKLVTYKLEQTDSYDAIMIADEKS